MIAELDGLRKYTVDSLCFSLFTTALCTTLFSLPLVHADKVGSDYKCVLIDGNKYTKLLVFVKN